MNARVWLLLPLFALSCGLRRPPAPMRPIVPSSAVVLRARIGAGDVELIVQVPRGLAGQVDEVRIMRRDPAREPLSVVIARLTTPTEIASDTRVWRFRLPTAQARGYHYRAVVIARDRMRYRLSDPLAIETRHLPRVAPRPSASLVARAVVLRWVVTPGTPGVLVYRRELPRPAWSLLTPVALSGAELVDQTVQEGKTYGYRLRYVIVEPRVDVIGDPSAVVRIAIDDVEPPYPPLGLKSARDDRCLWLSWEAVRDHNLLGYHVYLRKSGSSTWQRLTKNPVPE
ncbi:MAG: fibronectin type III domain-containing protein, partial [Myxococcales bacterium]|nr:fibronectin type III domain-containing protein [Myxococcales bacterium]